MATLNLKRKNKKTRPQPVYLPPSWLSSKSPFDFQFGSPSVGTNPIPICNSSLHFIVHLVFQWALHFLNPKTLNPKPCTLNSEQASWLTQDIQAGTENCHAVLGSGFRASGCGFRNKGSEALNPKSLNPNPWIPRSPNPNAEGKEFDKITTLGLDFRV